jgi:hypothetical protein
MKRPQLSLSRAPIHWKPLRLPLQDGWMVMWLGWAVSMRDLG